MNQSWIFSVLLKSTIISFVLVMFRIRLLSLHHPKSRCTSSRYTNLSPLPLRLAPPWWCHPQIVWCICSGVLGCSLVCRGWRVVDSVHSPVESWYWCWWLKRGGAHSHPLEMVCQEVLDPKTGGVWCSQVLQFDHQSVRKDCVKRRAEIDKECSFPTAPGGRAQNEGLWQWHPLWTC